MRTLVDAGVLAVAFVFYWINRDRRRHLKKRIGARALLNVYRVARNVGYMLSKKTLSVRDSHIRLKPGSILFSFHYGVWELMPRTLDSMGYRVGIIVNRYAGDNVSRLARLADMLLYQYRSVGRVLIFYQDEALKMVRFLRSGGILGVLVDGDALYAKRPQVVRLSRVCRAPLVPFAAYRKNGKGVLHIGCDLDALVKEQPLDYVWFYKSRQRRLLRKA